MANTHEETTRHLEQAAQVQREQFDMIRVQQESIDTLKQMLAQLLEDKKKSRAKTSSKKSKGKWKERESSSSAHIEEEEQSTLSPLSLHLKRETIQRMGALILKE